MFIIDFEPQSALTSRYRCENGQRRASSLKHAANRKYSKYT